MSAGGDMVTTACPTLTCGVSFSMPQHIWDQIRSRGAERKIYCPNGHVVIWTETNEDRLKRALESMTRDRDVYRVQAERYLKTARYWRGIAHRRPKVRHG